MKRTSVLVAGLLIVAIAGCATTKKQAVEAVARDWSKTIRASQIIPVYPLTEDLQPGDIFLVQLPIDRQQAVYQQKGYLPLDNHIARLNPTGYEGFYPFLTNRAHLPRDWIRPGESSRAAPRAAFPTYSFSVRRGGGLSLAVPVQGVPVGLSLLGSKSANGTISISKAATIGVDTLSLYHDLQRWALANADFLAPFAPSANGANRNYLRVVTRVYATGELEVTLTDADDSSAGADVGMPKPVNLLYADLAVGTNTETATLANYTSQVEALNSMLEGILGARDQVGNLLPGGSVKVAAASARAITLHETFDQPLVIGYLGFDCEVLAGGIVGPPIPTHSRLEKNLQLDENLQGNNLGRVYTEVIDRAIYNLLTTEPATNVEARVIRQRLDGLEQFVPAQTIRYDYDPDEKLLVERESPGAGLARDYNTYVRYVRERQTNLAALDEALGQAQFAFQSQDGTRSEVQGDDAVRQRLERVRMGLAAHRPNEAEAESVRQATSAAINYFIRKVTR